MLAYQEADGLKVSRPNMAKEKSNDVTFHHTFCIYSLYNRYLDIYEDCFVNML